VSQCFESCGNGVRTVSEGCDDGNNLRNDGCSATCTIECGYSCSAAEPNVCTTTCGDSVLAGDEICDDGNTVDGDGCSPDCGAVEDKWECSQASACGGSTCLSTESTEKVLLALQLPYTIAEFDQAKQHDFKAAMAKAASITPDRVFIQNITTVASTSRRLLSGSIQVDVSIAADSPSAAIAIATKLSPMRINAKLTAEGLASALLVEPPISTSSMRARWCPAGQHGPDNSDCVPCPAATYKSVDGQQSPCTPCPANTDSTTGSTNISACLCMQDFTEQDDGACVACPGGTYKNGLGPGECVMSELAMQEAVISDWLISESRKRPFCIPDSFKGALQLESPTGRGFWARFDRSTWAGRSMVMEMTLLDAGIASSARRASLPMTKTNLSKGRLVHLPSARLVYEADQKIKQGDRWSCGPDPLSVRQALREL